MPPSGVINIIYDCNNTHTSKHVMITKLCFKGNELPEWEVYLCLLLYLAWRWRVERRERAGGAAAPAATAMHEVLALVHRVAQHIKKPCYKAMQFVLQMIYNYIQCFIVDYRLNW